MDVVVAGGHGQIALRLLRLLAERGDRARGLIRNPGHAADLEAAGAEPIVCDMEAEDDLGPRVEGADAVVFAAGAGPGSGPERKKTVDLGAALKLIAAAKTHGVHRYVMVSALNADHPERASEAMRPTTRPRARRTTPSGPAASTTRSPGPAVSPTTPAPADPGRYRHRLRLGHAG